MGRKKGVLEKVNVLMRKREPWNGERKGGNVILWRGGDFCTEEGRVKRQTGEGEVQRLEKKK